MFFYALLSHKSAEVIWQLITDLRTLFPEYKYNVTNTIYFFSVLVLWNYHTVELIWGEL